MTFKFYAEEPVIFNIKHVTYNNDFVQWYDIIIHGDDDNIGQVGAQVDEQASQGSQGGPVEDGSYQITAKDYTLCTMTNFL